MTRAGAAPELARRTPGPEWSGLLPVDKPAGRTSHDVVALVRRTFGLKAVGHLGTLDPGATGLLILAIGAATRCAVVWQGGEKLYEGVARFGVITDTQDTQGRVLETRPVALAESAVREAATHLTGDILQTPPMVSALKHRGERLHDLARRGLTVEREPRPTHVAAWEWDSFAFPDAAFRVRCSGGTYVRTLVHDLGERVGCGAALASLRRLASEPFSIAQACPWAALEAGEQRAFELHGIELSRALETLPAVRLDEAQAEALGRGRGVAVAPLAAPLDAGGRSVVFRDGTGRALALGELRSEAAAGLALAQPHVVFPWAVREGRA